LVEVLAPFVSDFEDPALAGVNGENFYTAMVCFPIQEKNLRTPIYAAAYNKDWTGEKYPPQFYKLLYRGDGVDPTSDAPPRNDVGWPELLRWSGTTRVVPREFIIRILFENRTLSRRRDADDSTLYTAVLTNPTSGMEIPPRFDFEGTVRASYPIHGPLEFSSVPYHGDSVDSIPDAGCARVVPPQFMVGTAVPVRPQETERVTAPWRKVFAEKREREAAAQAFEDSLEYPEYP
jgi:hypothetical protein